MVRSFMPGTAAIDGATAASPPSVSPNVSPKHERMVNLVGDGPNIVLLAYFGNTRQFSGRSYRAGRIAG